MKVYGIHPADKGLKFLKRVNTDLQKQSGIDYTYLRLEANHQSHEKAIKQLLEAESGLLIFLCHALDKSIRGCNIVHSAFGRSHKEYSYGALISPSKNLKVFDGKSVFCLACNSKEIGPYAIDNGAKVYLGFGNIPFFLRENFKVERVTNTVKKELATVIYQSLKYALATNSTFNELSQMIQIGFDQRISY